MRYIKVLLAVLLFYFVMLFFVQNQAFLSQATPLKLDLMVIPAMESASVPYYALMLVCFLLGALCALTMLIWDRLSISAHLGMSHRKVRALEKELAKTAEATEVAKTELSAAKAAAEAAQARASAAEQEVVRAHERAARQTPLVPGTVSFTDDLRQE